MITVDCGIGSADEVRALRRSGIEVLVTDHHQPPPAGELPECTILHPVVSAYPFEGLCAAGVAQKLATALRSAGGERRVETVGGSRGRPIRTSTWSPWRRSPTLSPWSARTGGWCGRACGGSAASRGPGCAP